MSDRRLSPEQRQTPIVENEAKAQPQRKLLIALWIVTMALGTTGWWAGIAWVGIQLFAYIAA